MKKYEALNCILEMIGLYNMVKMSSYILVMKKIYITILVKIGQ